jgi:hypothetical protein
MCAKPGQAPLPKRKWNGMGRSTKQLTRDRQHQPVSARKLAMSLPDSAWKNVVCVKGTVNRCVPALQLFAYALRIAITG